MKILGILIIMVALLGGFVAIVNRITQATNALPSSGASSAQTNAQQQQVQNQHAFLNANISAPELTGITAWLNPDKAFTLKSLQGKVVLVDFWTNQCINCIHTLPYVTRWYDMYKDQGFVVIGVHTPELAYEHSLTSIQDAIKTYGIHYPVAQDNNYATWNAYSNQYWPAMYLVDKKGIIRRTYFGEGEYDQTELAIQSLLKE